MDLVLSLVGLLLIAMVVVVVMLPRLTTAGWAHGSMLRVFVLLGWLLAVAAALLMAWKTDWNFWLRLVVALAVWALAVGTRLWRVIREANDYRR